MPRVYFAGNIYDIGASEWSKICKNILGTTICTSSDLCSKINVLPQRYKSTFDSLKKSTPCDSDLADIPQEVFERQKSAFSHFWSRARIEQYENNRRIVTEEDSEGTLLGSDNEAASKEENYSNPIPPTPLPIPSPRPISLQPVVGPSNLQPIPLPSALQTSKIMDLSQLVSLSIESIGLIDLNLFNYEGFDPVAIRNLVFKISQEGNGTTISINGKAFEFHKGNSHNDLNFLVTLGLMRGNQLAKISNKSCKELQTVLKAMIQKYRLKEKTDGMSTTLTLMRIVNSFPEVAFSALQAGRGRDITGLGISVVLANSVSFQMVNRANFRKYAKHFLFVNHKIDRIINKKRKEGFTSLKELWNYLVLAYNSPIIPDGKRYSDIGTPLGIERDHFALSAAEEGHWLQICAKIDSNDPSQI